MNPNALSTSSKLVEEGVRRLESDVDFDEYEMGWMSSIPFYILDKFESQKSVEFIKQFNHQKPEDDPGSPLLGIQFSHCEYLVFAWKIQQNHPSLVEQVGERLNEMSHELAQRQRPTGEIVDEHEPIAWFLTEVSPNDDSTRRAIEYIRQKSYQDERPQRIAFAMLALSTFNHTQYEDELYRLGETLDSRIIEKVDSNRTIHSHFAFSSEAQMRVPELEWKSREDIYNHLTQEVSKSVEGDDSGHLGKALYGLIALGEGPKVSRHRTEWDQTLQEQRHARSKPEVVTTKPTTRMETRETKIRERTEELIEATDDILRISTIRMDMLHDEIVDKMLADDIDVRILTSTGSPSGARSKMKTAVMNDMVKRTDGNVREDELVHSRFVVSDHDSAIVSSADLTRDQLMDEYNAGVYTEDPDAVERLTTFFDAMWEDAEHRGQR